MNFYRWGQLNLTKIYLNQN